MSKRSLVRRAWTPIAGVNFFVTDRAAAFAAAEAKLTKALSAVPDHAVGQLARFVYIFTKRAAEGIAECEHALTLDRNLAIAHGFIGFGKIFIGRAEETEAHIGEALRLSPRDTFAFVWMELRAGEEPSRPLGGSARVVSTVDRGQPKFSRAHFELAAALAQLGRRDEAHSAVTAGLALHPAFSSPAPAPLGRR